MTTAGGVEDLSTAAVGSDTGRGCELAVVPAVVERRTFDE